MASTCTAMNLQCDTAYNARLRVLCTVTAASSDWMAFPAFSTAYAGSCQKTASPPQLIRNSSRTATSITVAFIAGSAGDCIFQRFELQYQEEAATAWETAPSTCGSLSVRSGPSCTISNLAQDTAYNFRARELCTNGAPLASPWGLTEAPLRTSFVPLVEPPTYLEPQGLISPVDPPTRLVLIFEVDLQLSNSGATLSLCPTWIPTATPADPGVCNCATSAECQAQCLTPATMTVEMVTPRVLFAQFGSVLRPLTGCPYIALLEAGYLQTQLQPSNPAPRIEWSFMYWPPVPTGTLSLYSSTTTSLTVRVTWSRPMTTICGVQVGSSIMHQTEPLDFTGSREFLEVRITGLTPFTQYTAVCTGVAISDAIVTATVSEAAFSTEKDTNDQLSDIILNVQAVCTPEIETDNGTTISEFNETEAVATLAPLEVALYPPFDPSVRHYQLTVNAEDVLTLCGESEVEAVFRIQVAAMAQSAFASVAVEPSVQIMAQVLPDETGFLPPDVPRRVGPLRPKCRVVLIGCQDPLMAIAAAGANGEVGFATKRWRLWVSAKSAFLQGEQDMSERSGQLFMRPPRDPLTAQFPCGDSHGVSSPAWTDPTGALLPGCRRRCSGCSPGEHYASGDCRCRRILLGRLRHLRAQRRGGYIAGASNRAVLAGSRLDWLRELHGEPAAEDAILFHDRQHRGLGK
ncbi:unnamed protein product [Symbiodinium sp. CCMP2592]|nr:unnamed protein product [Symbiodinium sp. CCMP2592]